MATATTTDVKTLQHAQHDLGNVISLLNDDQLALLNAALTDYLHTVDRLTHNGGTYHALDVIDDLQQFIADAQEARA